MGHKLETTAIAYRLVASTVTNVCRRGDRALGEKLHQHTRIECTQLPAVECPQRRQAPRCRHAPPGFEPGTLVQLTGGDLALQRKLSNGGNGLAFADGGLTRDESGGHLVVADVSVERVLCTGLLAERRPRSRVQRKGVVASGTSPAADRRPSHRRRQWPQGRPRRQRQPARSA
jgi:hypothetical protein